MLFLCVLYHLGIITVTTSSVHFDTRLSDLEFHSTSYKRKPTSLHLVSRLMVKTGLLWELCSDKDLYSLCFTLSPEYSRKTTCILTVSVKHLEHCLQLDVYESVSFDTDRHH